MNEKLVIRITHIKLPAEWTVLDAQGNRMGFPQKGELQIAAPFARQRQVVVIVSGPDITFHRLTLPIRSRKQLLQAVPFALEESLSEDIDQLHFVIGKLRNDKVDTYVCRHDWLENLISHIKDSGINPDIMVPDFSVIDSARERPVLAMDEDVIAYCDESRQWSLPNDVFQQLAPSMFPQVGSDASASQLLHTDSSAHRVGLIEKALGVESMPNKPINVGDSLLPVFAAGVHANLGVNLLQGRFKASGSRGAGQRNWRIPAALAAAWLLLLSANLLFEWIQFGKQDKQLDQAIEQVFHTALPGVNRIVNPRAQIEQELNRRGGNQLESDFLALLAISGVAIGKEPGTLFNAVSYSEGQIEISLNASNVQSLDNIKQYLTEHHGLRVEILSADTQENNVVGQLRISRGT